MSAVKPPSAAMASKVAMPLHPHLHLPPPRGPAFAGVLAAKTKTAPGTSGGKVQTAAGHAVVVAPHHEREPEARKHSHRSGREDDDLDPSARQAAQLAPPVTLQAFAEGERAQSAPQTNARVSMEELLPALVKKIAWSGDAQRGTVRMELGAGELAGATLMVSSEGGRVRVQLQAPPGTDVASWRERLRGRLEAKGLSIESLEVE